MTKNTIEPQRGDASPWSIIQFRQQWAPGVIFVETAGHGGFWVSPENLEKIPARWRAFAARWSHGWGEQWYEEDAAAVGVMAYVVKPDDPEVRRIADDIEARFMGAIQ